MIEGDPGMPRWIVDPLEFDVVNGRSTCAHEYASQAFHTRGRRRTVLFAVRKLSKWSGDTSSFIRAFELSHTYPPSSRGPSKILFSEESCMEVMSDTLKMFAKAPSGSVYYDKEVRMSWCECLACTLMDTR